MNKASTLLEDFLQEYDRCCRPGALMSPRDYFKGSIEYLLSVWQAEQNLTKHLRTANAALIESESTLRAERDEYKAGYDDLIDDLWATAGAWEDAKAERDRLQAQLDGWHYTDNAKLRAELATLQGALKAKAAEWGMKTTGGLTWMKAAMELDKLLKETP